MGSYYQKWGSVVQSESLSASGGTLATFRFGAVYLNKLAFVASVHLVLPDLSYGALRHM